ncbi:MAG TPA: outer membrane protein transport protein [Thermoanaerobaculia bacterium]|nr:outer membrane protein transport protein [Thermoanaerobaculia bacterium]
MRRRGTLGFSAAVGALVLLAGAGPSLAAGFGIFEQGAKAMGMAGAFTAQADDPSLLFHNAGGLAFVNERAFAAGVTYIRSSKADFRGAAPFPGPSAHADQSGLSEFIPHGYFVQPINQTWKVGLGIDAPFGLTTEWDPNTFAGRYISTKAALRTVDVNPTIGWQVTPTFGIGLGAIGRFSDITLERRVPAVNPFTQRVVDVAKVKLESDFNNGYGWNVGLLHRVNESFSWGLSYRSKIKIDYTGDGRLTQVSTGNAQLDAVLRTRLPFDRNLPIETSIEFPDMASLGLAFALSPDLLLETDANWTGWSSFDRTLIHFSSSNAADRLPDSTIRSDWNDVYNYRAGLRWTVSQTAQWRFGFVYDQTPQPEEAVSPLLPDADRNGFTIGYGHTGTWKTDVALMYLDFKERKRAKTFPDESPFLGTYNTKAWLLGVTVGF